MPTFLQETFRKERRKSSYKWPLKHQYKPYSRHSKHKSRKRSGYSLGKETEGIVRTTGTMIAAGTAIGAIGLISKLGK